MAFADPGEEQAAFADMQRRWPHATYVEDHDGTAALAQRIFDTRLWRADQPLRVVLIGTDFEVRVWETLLKIPMGRAVCYSDIASKIKSPKASRAVGAAVGRNPVSFVVPCHRALGKERRADRLSLGHHPQAGDARLGSRTGRVALTNRSVGKARVPAPCRPIHRSENAGHRSTPMPTALRIYAARSSFDATVASALSR